MSQELAAPADSVRAEESARSAGRGGIAVLGAKVFFLVVGFVQQPLLRLAVGLGDFGALAQALVVANTVNNVVTASGTQGVSRAVAGAPGREGEALRAALRVHVPLALAVAAAMGLAAPLYARFEHAGDVVPPLLVLAGVALLYGLYAPLIGFLNGTRRFALQAALDVTFATLRTLGLVGLGYAFARHGLSGVLGATVGWVGAAACIVPLAAKATGLGRDRASAGTASGSAGGPAILGPRAYLAVLWPIAAAQLSTNALLQADLAFLGHFLSEGAAGLGAEAQREAVKVWVGTYKECQTFAFLPYQLLFSITLILFPMLARARAEGDEAAVKAYVERGARLAALFAGLLVSVIVAMPAAMLSFAYGAADAARGADVLRTLTLAQGAFTMLGIATTVLTSLGDERDAARVTAGAVVAVGVACAALVPGAAFGHAQLVRSAQATGAALAIALVVGGVLVKKRVGAFVPAATAARVGLAVGACTALGFFTPCFGRLLTPVAALAVAGLYGTMLTATGELRRSDLGMLRSLRSRS
jgi:stage V sporulation protein B